MKVATCTPVDFAANAHFFSRDTGLLCRGFQQAGADCVVIMPGRPAPDDAPDLVRCSASELHDPEWWRTLRLDLVVLYAWGDPRHAALAQAIRQAGIALVQSLDTAGLPTPYGDCNDWRMASWATVARPEPVASRIRALAKVCRDLLPAAFERHRLDMINQADAVAALAPAALASVAAYAKALGCPTWSAS